jgi:hypothetical protein
LETQQQEKWQQRRIEDSLSSLQQSIVLDDEEEVIDEFPPLNEQQLHLIRFAMQGGSRNDVSKTNPPKNFR